MIPRYGREVSRIEGFSDAVVGFALTLLVVLALAVPIQWIWTAGVIYAFQGPLHWRNGVLIARARARAFPSSTPARP